MADLLPTFEAFPKIHRLENTKLWITEKIDGTNASVYIGEDGTVCAASRSRWITPEDDNFGFAKWVKEHEEELKVGLGPGHHFGEWWGHGIQRGYNQPKGVRHFSLFNVGRWIAPDVTLPECVETVPLLWTDKSDWNNHSDWEDNIAAWAAIIEKTSTLDENTPGEGIMLFLDGPHIYLKHPFKKGHKGEKI